MKKDSKLRADIGIYEKLMEDVEILANMFIGNQSPVDFTSGGEYVPFVQLVAAFHFDPDKDYIYNDLMDRVELIEKMFLKFKSNIQHNHKKAKFISRK